MLYWQDWLDQGRRALRTADLAREAGEHAWACFLYQQAAEMALKAALDRCGRDRAGHNLVALLEALAEARDETPPHEISAAARRLTRLYIPTRYPDAAGSAPGELYNEDDSGQAGEDARGILAVAEEWIGEAPDA